MSRSLLGWLVSMTVFAGTAAHAAAAERSPLGDWAVSPGFALEVDSAGFNIPTAITFVPEPGSEPDAPLYFVTELRGDVKVVTRDRSVRTFATVPTSGAQKDDLRGPSQQGLGGICLDPRRGHVFVTFSYPDSGGVLRNSIVRFSTTPRVFGLTPVATEDFKNIFADFQSAPAHQIGGCQVRGDSLFVGVGDGGNVPAAKNPDILLGKVLCLSVDGRPCPDNPFRKVGRPGSAASPADYVWAYGLRNPFGLALAGGDVFVAENGIRIDRVLRVERGADHLWDGSDQSIATGAFVVFPAPSPAPVQFTFLGGAPAFLPPTFANHFYLAAYASIRWAPRIFSGVIAIGYDERGSRVTGVPRYVLAYRGKTEQHVLGVAAGPDGLYVVPARPDAEGRSVVLKMHYNPGKQHSVVIGTPSDPAMRSDVQLFQKHACTSCHAIRGVGGGIGPSLDQFAFDWRVTPRLNSPEYENALAALDLRDDEPFVSFRDARKEVLAANGRARTRVWLKYFLLEPRFDNPKTLMPNPRLTEDQATALARALYRDTPQVGVVRRLLGGIRRNLRPVAFGFASGVGASAVIGGMLVGVYTWRTRRRRRVRPNAAGR